MSDEALLFSKTDYEFLQKALFIYSKAAEQQGEMNEYNQAMSLSSRLEQRVHKGDGMSVELKKRYEARIAVAQQNGDGQQLARILRDFIASQVRVEADPGLAIANTCMASMMKANMGQAASMFIPIVQKKLLGLQNSYIQEGFPESRDLLDYFNDWLAYGLENLQHGREPWAEDEHLNKEEPS